MHVLLNSFAMSNNILNLIQQPKSIELDELYGAYDWSTFEWKDGILSTIFQQCSEDERPAWQRNGLYSTVRSIDAMWMESMNSDHGRQSDPPHPYQRRPHSAHELDEFSVRDARPPRK